MAGLDSILWVTPSSRTHTSQRTHTLRRTHAPQRTHTLRRTHAPRRTHASRTHASRCRFPVHRAPRRQPFFESVSPSRRNSSSGIASWPDVSRVRSTGVSRVQSTGVSTTRSDVSRARPVTVLVSQSRSDRRTRDCSVLSPFATMALPFLPKRF